MLALVYSMFFMVLFESRRVREVDGFPLFEMVNVAPVLVYGFLKTLCWCLSAPLPPLAR